MRWGIEKTGPKLWNGAAPELAVSGPNVGSNLFLEVHFSGTVGAAVEAVNKGIPALAFSGATEDRVSWKENPAAGQVYAELATTLTEKIISSGTPYLPNGVFLNINFPKVSDKCASADDFKFVLTRINPGLLSEPDVNWCGGTRLPTESDVIGKDGCYAAISPGDASDKTTVNDGRQGEVLAKLKDILTCLP